MLNTYIQLDFAMQDKTMNQIPTYDVFLKYLEHNQMLESIGCSDDLEEFLLNDAVSVLEDKLTAQYNIPRDTLIDIVYDITYEVRDKFKYLSECYYAEGYSDAVSHADSISEEVGAKIIHDVCNPTSE